MVIPPFLSEQIRQGKAVIILGAGASFGAMDAHGNRPPSGAKLGKMLADKFLGGAYADNPLSSVAEYAISESSLQTVQEFVRDIFEGFQPSHAHKLLPRFMWSGIATTNYDRLVEVAYEQAHSPLQKPKPFIENGDRVDDYMRDSASVMLLKLHGCITRLSKPQCPLILTPDQYITHRQGRSRIFDHFKSWAYERPIIFIGHSLQDSDLRAILLEVSDSNEGRPRYYTVTPDADDIVARFWETKKITVLKGTFDDFLQSLDAELPQGFRNLTVAAQGVSDPIMERFATTRVGLSRNCQQFLANDVDYVSAVISSEVIEPTSFYRGHSSGWSAVEQGLDVRRSLGDTILADNFLIEEAQHLKRLEVIVIKAHAGAGKSVLLRRIAWDAARDYNCLCLYLKDHGVINTAAVQEIIEHAKERVFLFIDNAGDYIRDLSALAHNIGQEGKMLTVVVAERINEWNVSCGSLTPYVTSDYELKYLTLKEITNLLALLRQHRALGTLDGKSTEQQYVAFAEHAGRQLLVALHEATLGKPFEDIIEDEYKSIEPLEAQRIYLTICVLNRLGVPVRAGIIARMHGVAFSDFNTRFFHPLEHVVYAKMHPLLNDFLYQARHQVIAEIVFDRALRVQEERFDVYIRCLKCLNVDYASDRTAFRHMVRGRVMLELFPNSELVKEVYRVAKELVGDEPHLLHQMAIYEMNRANGNFGRAADMLAKAALGAPHDPSIKHSRSEVLLKMSDHARTPLEREKLLREASEVASSVKSTREGETFAHHTLVKIDIRRLKDVLALPEPTDAEIESVVRNIERHLSEGLQQRPGDTYLLTAEAELARVLSDSKRVVETLQKAFTANPRASFLAARLSVFHAENGHPDKALEILEQGLAANRNDRTLHYQYGKLLMRDAKNSADKLEYHFQRAFTPGDKNYDAQLLYGRQLFLRGERDPSKKVFFELRQVRIAPEIRDQLLYPVEGVSRGSVARLEASYCFVNRDGGNDWIYVHRKNIKDTLWRQLSPGSRVHFKIAFTFHGPSGFDLEMDSLL